MHNKNYISVGIDVGSAFSFMPILAPDETVILKPFKITHNNKGSLERAVSEIKKAERYYYKHLSALCIFLISHYL